jgi:putative ABC transport system substrate-binding protein
LVAQASDVLVATGNAGMSTVPIVFAQVANPVGPQSGSPNALADFVAAFHSGLNEAGYIEHRNVGIDYRWPEGQYDLLPALAVDLVHRQVSVIVTFGGIPGARAAKTATTRTPSFSGWGLTPLRSGWSPALTNQAATLRASPHWAMS